MMKTPGTFDAVSAPSDQTNPTAVISAPNALSGRRHHANRPVPMNAHAISGPEDRDGDPLVAQRIAGEMTGTLTAPTVKPARPRPTSARRSDLTPRSSATAPPESWSLGRKPRAPLRRISSAESDQSRLEVSTTAGAASPR